MTGMMPRHIPMFWNDWKANQQPTPAAARRPKRSWAWPAMTNARHSSSVEQPDDHRGPDETELLAGDGEDEVGLLLGHEAGAGLGAVEQALAEHAAVADGDARLLGVVAGAERVERGVR